MTYSSIHDLPQARFTPGLFSLMTLRLSVLLLAGLLPSLAVPVLGQTSPAGRRPQIPTRQQLADSYQRNCVGQDTGNSAKAAYCRCAFDRLAIRYTPPQIVAMNQLLLNGGPAVLRFSSIAFEPDYAICRSRTGYTPSRSSR